MGSTFDAQCGGDAAPDRTILNVKTFPTGLLESFQRYRMKVFLSSGGLFAFSQDKIVNFSWAGIIVTTARCFSPASSSALLRGYAQGQAAQTQADSVCDGRADVPVLLISRRGTLSDPSVSVSNLPESA